MNWNNNDYNEIARNKIWAEHVEKEKARLKPKLIYTKNPHNSTHVTEKVGYRVGLDPVHIDDDEADDVKKSVASALNAHRTPRDKYDQPQTSSHQIGWYTKPLMQTNARFYHGLQQGDATKFSETYTRKMGVHLFSTQARQ